ncbi:MAG TPA: glycosyl hydrolase [Pyrinomonadaceae bacterium]|nr:glycosyl hydrolase [Pyrinomonadaceae bacterium]
MRTKTYFASLRLCGKVLLLVLIMARLVTAGPMDDLQASFVSPPDDARIMMRWWWFGPTVEKVQLEREMRLMKEGGIGGFEVQPVYPLILDESNGRKTLPFLSDEFIDALRFTAGKARELGLRFDLTLGSGWPFGGPTVKIDHAAARLRYEHVKIDGTSRTVKVPAIGAGEKLLAVFLARVEGSAFAPDSVRELTDVNEGVVTLANVPAGQHEVLFFISSHTGMQVKRPAVGGEGFVLDHLNRAATDAYLKTVGDRLLQAFGSQPPYAIFCDSLEVYNADWSHDFLEEFKKRRGYDLKPHLPALVADMGRQTKALRRDWGMTLTELLNERFMAPMRDWSKRNGTRFRVQGYGVPPAAISSNAYADLPEGEGAQWKVVRATRWASSASHIYGRPVTSSETWTWLHSPAFRATPLDVKAEADVHFLQGINQLIGHGWPYTAPGVEYPGWRFYAAGVFNDKNPWWIVMPDVAKYLQRVSFMMRQGRPMNDVAVYLPNDDGWAHMTPGNPHLIEVLRERIGPDLLPAIFGAGFNLDFFDEDAFKQVGRIANGSLALGPNNYKIIILPNVESISLETYRKFAEFVRGGGVLIATRRTPAEQAGFLTKEEDHQQVVGLSKQLFGGQAAGAHFVADEKQELRATLRRLVTPDLDLSPATADVGFVHRQTPDAEIYFIANTANVTQKLTAMFRVAGMRAEWWNAIDGKVQPAPVTTQTEIAGPVPLELPPYGSTIVVFSKRNLPAESAGSSTEADTIDLSRDWQVSFGPAAPTPMRQLTSWTDSDATRYFSGVATYEKDVEIPADVIRDNQQLKLDFGPGSAIPIQTLRNGMQAWYDGPIRDAAVVYINDKRAGSLWCPPYSIDVTGMLRPGANKIRVMVANTAINYMAGHSLPDYRLLNLRYGERFQPQDMDKVQPVPSGLLGPIRLIPETRVNGKPSSGDR